MSRQEITFLLTGLIAELCCVALGTVSLVFLVYGVGPLLFVAIVAGIAITGAWGYVRVSVWRYLAGLLVSAITYVAGLVAFSGVAGFSPDWFGFQRSADILDLRIDILLGLIAAGAVAASGITLVTALLTREWSNSLLFRLMLAGLVTVGVTFIANLPFHSYWSFLGVLFPVGGALFCWLVGTQIWRNPKARVRSQQQPPQDDDRSMSDGA
jgi:hypothetical protein